VRAIDPYLVLGVRRNASKSNIRAAYRRRAKASHPDIGGDAEAFGRLKLAHDVLMDDERRDRFDRTGEVDQGAADNAMAAIVSVLSRAFDGVVSQLFQHGRSPSDEDVVKHMHSFLVQLEGELAKKVSAENTARELLAKCAGRFTVKHGQNVLNDMIAAKVRTTDHNLAVLQAEIEQTRKAATYLEQYGYNFDRPPPPPASGMTRVMLGWGISTSI
jgi:DnaJ-class molecular chaperone